MSEHLTPHTQTPDHMQTPEDTVDLVGLGAELMGAIENRMGESDFMYVAGLPYNKGDHYGTMIDVFRKGQPDGRVDYSLRYGAPGENRISRYPDPSFIKLQSGREPVWVNRGHKSREVTEQPLDERELTSLIEDMRMGRDFDPKRQMVVPPKRIVRRNSIRGLGHRLLVKMDLD